MSVTNFILEIASSDYTTTAAAVAGGADRIELCANLAEGGTTPSFGLVQKCREKFDIPIYPIIRPRGGDFLYSKEEFEIMSSDVLRCKQLGSDGVVIGMLTADGSIDIKRVSKLIAAAYPMEVTFHRAFDRCREPQHAMEQLIALGCQRMLTSGQQPSVMDGIQLLTELNRLANDRIIIMPGSGVRKENIGELARQTGCIEFHSSLRTKVDSKMEFIHAAFHDSAESYFNNSIDADEVKALKRHLIEAG